MTPAEMTNEQIANKIVSLIESCKIQQKILKWLSLDYLKWLNTNVREFLKVEPNVVYLEGRFVIVGDLHGQLCDLDRILYNTFAQENTKYVFLGDYVDRGAYSLEVISLLFTLKVLFPNRILLLRGNHECRYLTTIYGFKEECISKTNEEIYNMFVESFQTLPLCAILNNKIFCVHGGISQYIQTIADIMVIDRFHEVPSEGPMMDLLWADPDEDVDTFEESERGKTYTFGLKPTLDFLKKNKLALILRGHECVDDGFDYPFEYLEKAGCKCILTIFSASDYIDCENDAAYGVYERKLEFHSLPIIKKQAEKTESTNNTPELANNSQSA